MKKGLFLIEKRNGSLIAVTFRLEHNLSFSVSEAKSWLKEKHDAKSVKHLKSKHT